MNEGKKIVINGTDYTDYFTRIGYTVTYESVIGNNAGIMLDGSYTEDELKIRAVVTLPCMPLDQDKLGTILREVFSSVYHNVEYYDTMIGGYKTVEMRRKVSTQKYRGIGADEKEYWTGIVITFTER